MEQEDDVQRVDEQGSYDGEPQLIEVSDEE